VFEPDLLLGPGMIGWFEAEHRRLSLTPASDESQRLLDGMFAMDEWERLAQEWASFGCVEANPPWDACDQGQ
jgi:hypothetical protein